MNSDVGSHPFLVALLQPVAIGIIGVIVLYSLRHLGFTLNRLFGHQRHPYIDVTEADWPAVSILVPAHNEEGVVTHILEHLLEMDYPVERMDIVCIDDRSTDATGAIVDNFVHRYPTRIRAIHRPAGALPGKAAALADVTSALTTEIALIFDADYLPGPGLVKQLVAPFFDSEIGAVMGRVVPFNGGRNLLTRLLELERAGGYQVDQQARANLGLVPQFGGTVGGVRVRAAASVGGWNPYALAEDTDMTYRLLIKGWKIAYQNRSECYEEVVETWAARYRQMRRWAQGHNQVMLRQLIPLLRAPGLRWKERLDGAALLGVYAMAPMLLLGWLVLYILWLCGDNARGFLLMLAVVSYGTFGNAAGFYEIAAALRLDGEREKIRLLPLVLIGFFVSTYAATGGLLSAIGDVVKPRRISWHKTPRYRQPGEDLRGLPTQGQD